MKLVPLSRPNGTVIGNVDEHTSLATIREKCPLFFKTAHGKRETYTMHRGQLIVRNTVKFTGLPPQRKTTIYLFFVDSVDNQMDNDVFCHMKDISDLRQAKRTIDHILDVSRCAY